MKPWHARQDSRSDFAATATGAARTDAPSSAVALARGVGSLGAATFLLAFTEACLHLEKRPIPLRFAARYAAVNVLPSAVWKTVPVHYFAAAANLPPTRLVTAAAGAIAGGEPNLAAAPRKANRLIAIHTLRSVRCAVASYGLVWTLWRWHETQQSVDEDSAKAPSPAGRVERVVRLAPAGSSLSVATAEKHGAHVVQIPWNAVRGNSIDWSSIRLDKAWRHDGAAAAGDANGNDVKVLELEIDSDHDDAAAFMIAKRTASGAGSGVRTVAVVDAAAAPVWRSRVHGADVYFFALSAIIRFLSDHCQLSEGEEFILTASEELEGDAAKRSQRLLSFVRRAIVHRVGVPTSVGLHHLTADEHDEDDDDKPASRPPAMVVVFAASAEAAARQLNEIVQTGAITLDRVLVVVDQSIGTLPAPLSRCAGVLSVADLSDSVLQRIRVQFRAGSSPEAIQHTIFEEFGEQSALLHRTDAASDTTKYI